MLQEALKLTGIGLATVFVVLAIFYLLIRLMVKVFVHNPDKE